MVQNRILVVGRKSFTGNELSDINFLYDVESYAVRRCFRLF